jgi:enoyl-[acyl-carrier protein] reductase III
MLECRVVSDQSIPARSEPVHLHGWALVLGASSGFGEAVSVALARAGLDIFGVHLDRKATLANAERIAGEIRALGRAAIFFNINAADAERRAETVAAMDMTLDVMAHSLVYWTQEVVGRGLMGPGGRVYAMTSAGGTRVLPHYGPVSAAKAALESHVRQLAAELAPLGITANAIRAGVTATPAAQKIPGYESIAGEARRRNPHGRMTTTADVARALVVLAHPDTYWMTGNVIGVDGGEDIVG